MFDRDGPVLGVAPGLSQCGYGVVRRHGRGLAAVACGVLPTAPADPLPERLATLEADLDEFLREVRPCALAVERVLFQANVRTAISVGQASGLALAVAARAGVPVTHYSPNEVKLAIAANGAAGKRQVQAMVTRVPHLPAEPPPHPAHALALSLCHLLRAPLRESRPRPVAPHPA